MTNLEVIDNLIDKGEHQKGFQLLKCFVEENPDHTDQAYRFAVLSEQLGSEEETKAAYLNCLRVAKNNVLCYLYAGIYFINHHDELLGLAVLVCGHQLDARLTMLYRYQQVAAQTKQRSYQADIALRDYFTNEHQRCIGDAPELSRVRQAIWPQTHNQKFEFLTDQQRPHLFYLPSISARPFWPASDAMDVELVSQGLDDIQREFNKLTDKIDSLGEPYLAEQYKQQGFEQLAGSKKWTALHLYKDGVLNQELAAVLPKTLALLNRLPLYGLDETPFEVFYSVLKAGQHITPHYGLSNHSLTVHLPLVVPGDGHLKVADEKQGWHVGELIAFDDSYIHEAINLSDEDRIVLIFSVWHPELSLAERKAIQQSFEWRKSLLKYNQNYLDKLL